MEGRVPGGVAGVHVRRVEEETLQVLDKTVPTRLEVRDDFSWRNDK